MKILIRVDGYNKIGLGHIYRVIALGHNLMGNHEILYVSSRKSELGIKLLTLHNFKVKVIDVIEDLKKIIDEFNPNVVINDILDTTRTYMSIFKKRKIFTVNFEDLGEGAKIANLTINALYEKKNDYSNCYWGKNYYILREEFHKYNNKIINPTVQNILISFGGTDPNNYTEKIIEILNELELTSSTVSVILGLGYLKMEDLLKKIENFTLKVNVKKNVKDISRFMYEADLVFTSAGRTVYELASMGVPTIVLAQNERELLHTFASEENGVINLGLGYKKSQDEIKKVIKKLLGDNNFRKRCNKLMLKNNLKSGINNVINLIYKEYKKFEGSNNNENVS